MLKSDLTSLCKEGGSESWSGLRIKLPLHFSSNEQFSASTSASSRGINEVGGQQLIEMEGHEAELKTIRRSQLTEYSRYQQSYPYPSMVNRNTDLDVWKAKASRLHLEGNLVKFRAAELTTAIAESCPEAFDASSLCVYLKRVMFSKIRFESFNDLDFPVTEEMFKQIWLERLREDKGYGEILRHAVKNHASTCSTVAYLIESLAEEMNLKSDPKALVKAFNQNGQGTSEDVRSYIFRKHQECRTIMVREMRASTQQAA